MYLFILIGPIITLCLLVLVGIYIPRNFLLILFFNSLILSMLCSLFCLYEVVFLDSTCIIEINTWFSVGLLNVKWSFLFDKISCFLLFIIIFISLLVHFFSLDYLNEDPHLSRFLMLLTLFTVFMEVLVTSGNLIQFFFGWEGVGLMSYLLINFWFTRYGASNAGLMAIIYNKVGDMGLLLAITLICTIVETADFLSLFLFTNFVSNLKIQLCYSYFNFLDLVTILLFLGVIGKSAQIFLESWLASAMEGPTPVSSLLHASTMIVSGVFLLLRFQSYILSSLNGVIIITFVGALTAFFAGTIGLVATDLKRIIAYSTCSQMGYLVCCFALGNANLSFFHLVNHAFFKCLLFVAAGTLIHAIVNEQDIRQMGGFYKLLPFSYILIVFASFSLMGVPFFSGFYSKEKIIEDSFYIFNHSNFFGFWLVSFSAFVTAIYSIRLIMLVFFGVPNNLKSRYEGIHLNIKFYLNCVLFLLGLGSIFSGFFFEELIIGLGNDWYIMASNLKLYNVHLDLGNLYINSLPFYYTCLGFFVSILFLFDIKFLNIWFFFYYNKFILKLKVLSYFNLDLGLISLRTINFTFIKKIYIFLAKRWFLNLTYNRYGATLAFNLGYNDTFNLLDKGFFEATSLVSTRKAANLSRFFSRIVYRFSFFGELLFYIFSAFCLIYIFFFINFLELIIIFCNNSFYKFFFLGFLFAVPRKKVRIKNLRKKFLGKKLTDKTRRNIIILFLFLFFIIIFSYGNIYYAMDKLSSAEVKEMFLMNNKLCKEIEIHFLSTLPVVNDCFALERDYINILNSLPPVNTNISTIEVVATTEVIATTEVNGIIKIFNLFKNVSTSFWEKIGNCLTSILDYFRGGNNITIENSSENSSEKEIGKNLIVIKEELRNHINFIKNYLMYKNYTSKSQEAWLLASWKEETISFSDDLTKFYKIINNNRFLEVGSEALKVEIGNIQDKLKDMFEQRSIGLRVKMRYLYDNFCENKIRETEAYQNFKNKIPEDFNDIYKVNKDIYLQKAVDAEERVSTSILKKNEIFFKDIIDFLEKEYKKNDF